MPKLFYVGRHLTCERTDLERFLSAVAARGRRKARRKKATPRVVRQAGAPPEGYPLEWLSADERQRVLAHRHPERPPTSMDPLAAKAGGLFA
jgi:hypothetical protein